MSKLLLVFMAVGLSFVAMGCGDDEETGGGGCANAQMVCEDDPSVEIDCTELDMAPANIKQCAGNASTCDAVLACLIGS